MDNQLSTLNPAAKAVVCPVNPEHKVIPANRVDQENPELQDSLATQENHQQRLVKLPLHHHANLAHKVLPDLLDHPDLQETQERLVLPADLVMMLLQEPLDLEDHPVHLVSLDHPAVLVRLVFQLLPSLSLLALPENPEISDLPDPLDLPVNPVWMAHPDLPDPRENLVSPETQEPTETPVPQAPLDQPDPPEKRVSARNTAPSMVVSSSKTELVVKFANRVYASSKSAKHLMGRCVSNADSNIFSRCRVDDVPTSSWHLYSILFYASLRYANIVYVSVQ